MIVRTIQRHTQTNHFWRYAHRKHPPKAILQHLNRMRKSHPKNSILAPKEHIRESEPDFHKNVVTSLVGVELGTPTHHRNAWKTHFASLLTENFAMSTKTTSPASSFASSAHATPKWIICRKKKAKISPKGALENVHLEILGEILLA